MNIHLRNAHPADIAGIMAVERDAFIPEVQEAESVFAERIQVFPDGFLVLVDNDCSICGYFSSERWPVCRTDASVFQLGHSIRKNHTADGPVLYISSMGILSRYRGTGLGRRLFEESLCRITASCSDIERIILLVNEHWDGARHIYQTNGFTEQIRLINFFPSAAGGREDGIIMERDR